MPCTSDCCSSSQPGPHTTARYRKVLWAALAINFGMFIIEIVMSARSGSVSLMSDSLDFLGDAGNYLISLLVLSMALHHRARASLLKGATMAAFGTWVLLTTLYQFWAGSLPNYHEMSIVGVLALLANVTAAALLYTFREGDSNMRGVWICSRNDAIGSRRRVPDQQQPAGPAGGTGPVRSGAQGCQHHHPPGPPGAAGNGRRFRALSPGQRVPALQTLSPSKEPPESEGIAWVPGRQPRPSPDGPGKSRRCPKRKAAHRCESSQSMRRFSG